MNCQNCSNCLLISKDNKIYYEIHITVEHDVNFIFFCKENNIKIIDVDLGKNIPSQLMTSIVKSFDSDIDCYSYVQNLLSSFSKFKILRMKVEVSPNHSECLSPKNYFESHLAISNPDENLLIKGLHKSKNKLKTGVQMMTLRKDNISLEEFKSMVEVYKNKLTKLGYIVEKIIIEYCLFDSNEKLDNLWINDRLAE